APVAAPLRPRWPQQAPRRAVLFLPVVLILGLAALALALQAPRPLTLPTAAPRAAAPRSGGTVARITSRAPQSVPPTAGARPDAPQPTPTRRALRARHRATRPRPVVTATVAPVGQPVHRAPHTGTRLPMPHQPGHRP